MRFYSFAIFITLISCSSTKTLTKKEVYSINQYYQDKRYILKRPFSYPNFSYKKGDKVKIFVESTPTLFKIKMYSLQKSNEQNPGHMLFYLVYGDMKKSDKIDTNYINKVIRGVLNKN